MPILGELRSKSKVQRTHGRSATNGFGEAPTLLPDFGGQSTVAGRQPEEPFARAAARPGRGARARGLLDRASARPSVQGVARSLRTLRASDRDDVERHEEC
jgi:hypothetical protein